MLSINKISITDNLNDWEWKISMKKRIISLLLTIPMLFTIGCSKNNKINESEGNLEGKINIYKTKLIRLLNI